MKLNLNKYTNEVVMLGLAIALYIFTPYFTRLLDPTAGQFDAVYLQKLSFAAVGVAFASGFIKLMLHIPWMVVDNHLENLKTYWKDLTTWQKTLASLWLFSVYVWAFITLVGAME